jgi:hypothetical protein
VVLGKDLAVDAEHVIVVAALLLGGEGHGDRLTHAGPHVALLVVAEGHVGGPGGQEVQPLSTRRTIYNRDHLQHRRRGEKGEAGGDGETTGEDGGVLG